MRLRVGGVIMHLAEIRSTLGGRFGVGAEGGEAKADAEVAAVYAANTRELAASLVLLSRQG